MPDNIWDGWKITEEQRQKMMKGEREALDKFYFDNFTKIENIAKRYEFKKRSQGFGDIYQTEELLQDAYLNLTQLDFSRADYFVKTLVDSFYWTQYGGTANRNRAYNSGATKATTLFLFDSCDFERENDVKSIDKYIFYPSPDEILEIEHEACRLETIEQDIEIFLKGILTTTQLAEWKARHLSRSVINKLRRNSDKVIEFLRAHGTDEKLLSYPVLSIIRQYDPKISALEKEKKALRDWQESHIDELDSKTRKRVLQRLYQRAHAKERTAYYRNKKEAIKIQLINNA